MKIKFFKKEKHFKKENPEFNINFYWRLAVYFMFLAILFAFSFGLYIFIQIDKESVLSENGASSKVGTIKKERIEKVLKYFSVRKQISGQILNSPTPTLDPSL